MIPTLSSQGDASRVRHRISAEKLISQTQIHFGCGCLSPCPITTSSNHRFSVQMYSKALPSLVHMSSVQDWRIHVFEDPHPAWDPLYLCKSEDNMVEPSENLRPVDPTSRRTRSKSTSTSTSEPYKDSKFRTLILPKYSIAMQTGIGFFGKFPAEIMSHISPIEHAINRLLRNPTTDTYFGIEEALGDNAEARDIASLARRVVVSAEENYLKGRDLEKEWQFFWEKLVYEPLKQHRSICME